MSSDYQINVMNHLDKPKGDACLFSSIKQEMTKDDWKEQYIMNKHINALYIDEKPVGYKPESALHIGILS